MNKVLNPRMVDAVNRLADLIPYGHLLAEMDGEGLLERAGDIIEKTVELLRRVYEQTENGYRVRQLTRNEIREWLDSFSTEEVKKDAKLQE